MRLFHVSEEVNIKAFIPRIPSRADMNKEVGLVWAIDEKRLPNFLTPRNCPRVCFHAGRNTSPADMERFFTSPTITHAVVIEHKWYEIMKSTTLYLYEFSTEDFILQDDIAGYYVSPKIQVPVAKYEIKDLFGELMSRNVEIRLVDNLWDIADRVRESTLNWSLCRMGLAQPRQIG